MSPGARTEGAAELTIVGSFPGAKILLVGNLTQNLITGNINDLFYNRFEIYILSLDVWFAIVLIIIVVKGPKALTYIYSLGHKHRLWHRKWKSPIIINPY